MTVRRRSVVGALLGAIEGIELVAIARGLSAIAPELAASTAWLLLPKEVYDVEHPPLSSSASEAERRDYLDAVGAAIGDGELRIVLFGHAEPLDVVTVRPNAPFVAWVQALIDRPSPTNLFLFNESRDVAVLLLRRPDRLVARVAHGAAARLAAAVERERARRAAHAAEEVARIRTVLTEIEGVEIASAPASMPSLETLSRGVPWDESSPARRLRERKEPAREAWLAERLQSLAPGSTCTVWTYQMMHTSLSLRIPPGAAWLARLSAAAPGIAVMSGDGARILALRTEEYDDVACLVSVAAAFDRAASLTSLDAYLAASEGACMAAPTGPRDVDPGPLFAASRSRGRGPLAEPSEAEAHLAALSAGFDMAERLPFPAKRDGAVGYFALSIGREAPLAFRSVFTFDAGRWLVELWQTGMDRLFVARADDTKVLALRRVDGATESFLGPLRPR